MRNPLPPAGVLSSTIHLQPLGRQPLFLPCWFLDCRLFFHGWRQVTLLFFLRHVAGQGLFGSYFYFVGHLTLPIGKQW